MADYIVHKAVELSKVKAARRKLLEQPGYLEANYLGQAKYDGCNVIFVLTVAAQNDQVLSRTGERVRSLEHLLPLMHKVFADQVMVHGGLAVLGEAWSPNLSFAEISGQFRRHTPSDDLEVRVFDVLTSAEWEAGESPEPYIRRLSRVVHPPYNMVTSRIRSAETHFVPGTTGYNTWQGWAQALKARGGYDGLILRDPDGTWTRGSGTGGEIIKIKPLLSFDLRVTGLEEGVGKHAGRLGAIVVDFQGKKLRVGTGFSDAERDRFWTAGWAEDNPVAIYGKIVEIEALDFSEDGLLREPRFKGVRFDKLEAD